MVVGKDIEVGSRQGPPGSRQLAAGDESVIQNVPVVKAFGELSLEVERRVGYQDAGLGADAVLGVAFGIGEVTALLVDPVLDLVAGDLLVLRVALVEDVAAGFEIGFVLVVIDLVGTKGHVRAAQFSLETIPSPEVIDVPLGSLLGGIHIPPAADHTGTGRADVKLRRQRRGHLRRRSRRRLDFCRCIYFRSGWSGLLRPR